MTTKAAASMVTRRQICEGGNELAETEANVRLCCAGAGRVMRCVEMGAETSTGSRGHWAVSV